MTLENPEKIHETCNFLLFGWWKILRRKTSSNPPRTKNPDKGCSEEWKFEAEAPEGIAEERSSVLMEKRTGVVFFLVWENTQKKSERFLVWVWCKCVYGGLLKNDCWFSLYMFFFNLGDRSTWFSWFPTCCRQETCAKSPHVDAYVFQWSDLLNHAKPS